MNISQSPSAAQPARRRGFLILLICLLGVLGMLFYRSFSPNQIIFSNDGPLGAISAEAGAMPSAYFGVWQNLNWLGNEAVSAAPGFSTMMSWILKPMGYAKFFAPIAFLVLGISAWVFFRQLKLAPMACILAALATALNGDFFSIGCWGIVAQPVCLAANFLALAALANPSPRRPWLMAIMAGLAVGMGVTEGFDVGAIYSLFVAAFVLFQSWNTPSTLPPGKKLGWGITRLAVVAVFAAFIATQALHTLLETQVKGVVGVQQEEGTKKDHWPMATQWSLPKAEALQIIVPGLFGYRMDSPGGARYWGIIGEDPQIPEIQKMLSSPDAQVHDQAKNYLDNPVLPWRFSGTGVYAGVLVVVVALWAVFQSLRKRGSPFSQFQRRSIWFWSVIAIIGLLLSFGKYAPFYQAFYALPYASTIRNPLKFTHIFNWGLVIVFAYGLHGLFVAYMQNPVIRVRGLMAQFKNWRVKASPFERKWMTGCFLAMGAALLAALIFASSSSALISYLKSVGIPLAKPGSGSDADAAAVAHFSLQAVGWFVLLLAVTVGLLALVFSGQFSGPRAKWGTLGLGALLLFDLVHADRPWVLYWDATYKYATNPILEQLRKEPYEHRVAQLPIPAPNNPQLDAFHNLYGYEWHQHNFLYENIQALEMVQEPRTLMDKKMFMDALPANSAFNVLRIWELTNTRYLLGAGGAEFVEGLNNGIDPVEKRFRISQSFDLVRKPGATGDSTMDITAAVNPKGQLALLEFTGALPRASLFANWQVNTNDETTLQTLASPAFDPHKSVLVSDVIPDPTASTNASTSGGTAKIQPNYKPKYMQIAADVKVPSVLLLCDRFNPKWQVWVDGKQAKLLRCNFIERGVYLLPGKHDVEFRFVSPNGPLYVSLSAIIFGMILCGWLALTKDGEKSAAPAVGEPALSGKQNNIKA